MCAVLWKDHKLDEIPCIIIRCHKRTPYTTNHRMVYHNRTEYIACLYNPQGRLEENLRITEARNRDQQLK